ncbi:hypothetical protein H2204_013267 [Knufia peltigerae]|uniref:Uncharacterized protein n=1 Tax=Knufia peltigerae TaxID=1002370 RepID=A0AA39CRI6_9EURO|nr:hypothetical protein H2204_013267 [Knufia peltigerae]
MGSRDFTYETSESGKPGDVHAERILGPKLKDIVEWLTGTEPASNGGDGDRAGEGDRDGGDGRGGGGGDDDENAAAAAAAAAITCTTPAKRLN